MIARLLQAFGIDERQWRALTAAALKRDLRKSELSTSLSHGRSGRRVFTTLVFYYFVTGLIFVPIVVTYEDVRLTLAFLITYTTLMIGGLILIEYHSVVISPDDYEVLGYRPISSRTFFAARLSNLLFYVLVFTSVLALPSVVAFLFRDGGFRPLHAAAAFAAVFLANFTTALAIVVVYTAILKKVHLHTLENALAFLQVGMAFLVYSGFFIIPRLLESSSLQWQAIAHSRWLYLLPPTWFAAFVSLVSGQASSLDWLMALGALALVGLLACFAFSKLSLGYAQRLAALSALARKKGRVARRLTRPFMLFARAHEERVVSRLIRNQFLYDNKFKMAVLGILPLTIFYLLLGLEEGPLPDPFVTHQFSMSESGLLYLLVFLFPMMLRTYVTQSDHYQASWIFYTTPADVRRLILAEKNFLMIYFVLPFLFILGCIFYYSFGNLLHVLLHVLLLGLLGHLFLQFAFLYSPDLPFSRPNVKGSRSRNMAIFLVVIPFLTYAILPLVFRFVYSNAGRFVTLGVTLLAVSVILEHLITTRVVSHLKKHEFTG